MAECRRIDPNHVGPDCGCAEGVCVMDAPRPTSQLAAEVRAYLLEPRPSVGLGQDAYVALDALVARITDLEAQVANAWEHERLMMKRATAAEARAVHDGRGRGVNAIERLRVFVDDNTNPWIAHPTEADDALAAVEELHRAAEEFMAYEEGHQAQLGERWYSLAAALRRLNGENK